MALISAKKSMLSRANARWSGAWRQRIAARDQRPHAVEVLRRARDRREAADQHRQLQPQVIDLGELVDVDVGDDRADAVPRLDQPLRLEPRQHAADRRAADREFVRQLLFREPRARRVLEQADAVAQRPVDALEPLAGERRRPLRRLRAAARSTTLTRPPARRSGTAGCARSPARRRSASGGPCSAIRPP